MGFQAFGFNHSYESQKKGKNLYFDKKSLSKTPLIKGDQIL